jgi:hypothetical protein
MSHVKLLDLSLEREKFTHHGMHLNSKGKEKVARIIGQYLIDLLNRQDNNILCYHGLMTLRTLISLRETDAFVGVQSSEVVINKARASERSKKPPVTRSNDFFMDNQINNLNVKYKKTMTRGAISNKSININRGDKVKFYKFDSELDLNQSINVTCSHLIENDNGNIKGNLFSIPSQGNQNLNQQNSCMTQILRYVLFN